MGRVYFLCEQKSEVSAGWGCPRSPLGQAEPSRMLCEHLGGLEETRNSVPHGVDTTVAKQVAVDRDLL